MHGNEHGISSLIIKSTVRATRDLEATLGLRNEPLVKRLHAKLLLLCNSPTVQHMTLLTLGSQKILEGIETINKELKTKKKERSQPIVDANDVAKVLLALVFVLDGLAQPELNRFNGLQARPRDRVRDPFRPIIGGIQQYLQAYHMYRSPDLTVLEIERLDTMSRGALETLQRVFPYGVTLQNGDFRSWWCTEKPHAMTHWADNYVTVGRCRTMSTQPTECRMKSAVKTKARKTNNQASFGGSLLQNNMDVEASMELARHLDETGLHHVYTVCTCHPN